MTVLETAQPPAWKPLALLLAGAGVMHFVTPRPFESIVPKVLGDPRPWVRVSGVAELACAAGLAVGRTRRPAALATAALFVAVYPANLEMTARVLRSPRTSGVFRALTVARLPLQVPLVVQAWRLARAARSR